MTMGALATLQFFLAVIAISVQDKEVCKSQCVGYQTQFMKHSAENKALVDHQFISTTNFRDTWTCFSACASDCRCMSYNFQTRPASDGSHICELNSADYATETASLKDRPGFIYHDIVPYFMEGQNQENLRCRDLPCSRRCCESSPCQNGGVCHALCGQKKRLLCNCTAGFTGDLCTIKLKSSCVDHFKYNRSAVSGLYDIQDDKGTAFTVFCDFNSSANRAWTLIMSYKLANHPAQFQGKPLYKDHPVAENTPNWDAYRLSKTRMSSIQSQSTDWRATCNYNTDGVVYTDYMRSTFDNVDPITFKGDGCKKLAYLNIRGSSCQKCTVWIAQDETTDFTVASFHSQHHASPKCDFVNSAGVITYEQNFGFYQFVNPGHRCSSGPLSTTQYWFGAKLGPY